eukprot:10575841-Alexandrium_andersonii.AAC.1
MASATLAGKLQHLVGRILPSRPRGPAPMATASGNAKRAPSCWAGPPKLAPSWTGPRSSWNRSPGEGTPTCS